MASEAAVQLLAAMQALTADGKTWVTASDLAYQAGIRGNHRGGNGAVKGSWSGYTAPAFAAASTLRAMERRDEIVSRWSRDRGGRSRKLYRLSDAGREEN